MKRDEVTNTPDDAGRFDRNQTMPSDNRERDEGTVGDFEHSHGPGLICLKCAWLKARREHLSVVPADGRDSDWCERCAEEYALEDGCAHGLVLCSTCLHFCADCRADIEDAAAAEDRGRVEW